jgi:hypothetical protein
MSSASAPNDPLHDRTTPRVEPGKTALRAKVGRYTFDVLADSDENGHLVYASNGQLGQGSIRGRVSVNLVAAVLATAGKVRAVDVDMTPAWLLVAR